RAAWIVAAGFLGISLVFAGLYWWARSSSAPTQEQPVRLAVNSPAKTVFSGTVSTVPVVQFALSPDGRTIVFGAGAVGSRPNLWVRPLDDISARPLPGTEYAQNPFWSPDGLWIGFFAEGKLKKIPAVGGAVRVVAENVPDSRGGSWGPHDTILFADGSSPIYRV